MTPDQVTHGTIVTFIAEIIERRGADSYLGEPVSMSEHMLQVAMQAEAEGADETLIAAALLHDIGHYTTEFGADSFDCGVDFRHDQAGGQVLAPYFPRPVSDCVRLHVAAKRYLCAVDPTYFGKLSQASIYTLRLQGGPMSAEEIDAFELEPHHLDAVRVRQWDEGGKLPGVRTPAFAHYLPLLERIVAQHKSMGAATGEG